MGSKGLVVVVVVVVVVLARCNNGASQGCAGGDLRALRGFSARLDAPVGGWPSGNASASDGDCCAWPGVVCGDAAAGAVVVGVVLPNKTLRGEVSASLADLAALRVLNLSSNALRGALPPRLLRLRSLQVLDVSANLLAGAVDADLPAIRVFNVSYNEFNGSHPVVPAAGNLTAYDVSGNALEGPVDAAAICAASPGVEVLRFSMNRLSGGLTEGFGRCRSLVELSLDGNDIAGALPDDLFGLPSLQYLTLHSNSMSGDLSPWLRNLTGLVRLDISFNGFSGSLPEVFDALPRLEELSAPCNYFSGPLPATLSKCSHLRVLNLRNNSLSGGIGLDFGAVNNLVHLDLGINRFTGPIPPSLPECRGLTALNLGRNNLTGEVPASFATFPSLSFLSLTGNNFSNVASALRTLQRLPSLTSMVLTRNFRGGEAMPPDGAGIAGFANLEVLVIANCQLYGAIPSWLARLTKLKVLDLSWNRLTGPVPPWLGTFDRLFYLDISNNSLDGETPTSLTRMQGLVASGGGDVADDMPPVQEFPFFIRRNSSGIGLQYNQVSSFPPSLILGHNNLTGAVPAALGALTRVHVVDLSWNALSGPIPPELSGMSSLESLDLSNNVLSGAIPATLMRLSFLSHFDVAYNNLSGEVPIGGQFSTFSSADFEGNPGLCGIHVGPCGPKLSPAATVKGRKHRDGNAVVATAIGVGTALLLAAFVVAAWRAWSKRQEDNARVAADDDNGSLESSARSVLVLLFPDDDDGDGKRTMTLDDVLKATGNFDESRIVGCGGFGLVYRATLPDGRNVAVKRLSGDFWQMEREFRAEVETLSRVRHKNLVSLRGYCQVGNDRLLVYPYMENGSLDHWLHERADTDGGGALRWPERLAIARAVARGLAYLHDACEPRVLHRDIKSSNILLDAGLEPRLADFGLARLVRPHDTHVTTDLVGTLGYIPPEYGHSSVATYRGDVYSFGVVLLELVTGRRPVDMARPAGGRRDVKSWAVRLRAEARAEEAVDASIADRRHRDEAARVLDVACACVSENPKSRPSAAQLVAWLDGIADD